MGVVTYEFEIAASFPAARLFKAFVLDGDNLIPKIVPQVVKGTEFLEGDGGPGSIKKITFAEGSQFKNAKHKVEALDKENFFYSYSWIEGDALILNRFEKITYDIKLDAAADGGSVCKSTSKYYPIGDVEIKEGKERALGLHKAFEAYLFGLHKAFEAYLLANPDAYN